MPPDPKSQGVSKLVMKLASCWATNASLAVELISSRLVSSCLGFLLMRGMIINFMAYVIFYDKVLSCNLIA